MKRYQITAIKCFIVLFIALCLFVGCSTNKNPPLGVSIPTRWIKSASIWQAEDWAKRTQLVTELAHCVIPGKLPAAQSSADSYLSIIAVNLDDDLDLEYLILFGRGVSNEYHFCVIKRISGNWQAIHVQELNSFHTPRQLLLPKQPDNGSKIFYLLTEAGAGTGVLEQNFEFYQISHGKVIPCLIIPAHRHNIYESIDSRIWFNEKDLTVDFFCTFFADEDIVHKSQDGANQAEPDSLIYFEARYKANFEWNAGSQKYAFKIETGSSTNQLTVEKLVYLQENQDRAEKDFIRFFASELSSAAKDGTPTQKRLIKLLLERTTSDTKLHAKP